LIITWALALVPGFVFFAQGNVERDAPYCNLQDPWWHGQCPQVEDFMAKQATTGAAGAVAAAALCVEAGSHKAGYEGDDQGAFLGIAAAFSAPAAAVLITAGGLLVGIGAQRVAPVEQPATGRARQRDLVPAVRVGPPRSCQLDLAGLTDAESVARGSSARPTAQHAAQATPHDCVEDLALTSRRSSETITSHKPWHVLSCGVALTVLGFAVFACSSDSDSDGGAGSGVNTTSAARPIIDGPLAGGTQATSCSPSCYVPDHQSAWAFAEGERIHFANHGKNLAYVCGPWAARRRPSHLRLRPHAQCPPCVARSATLVIAGRRPGPLSGAAPLCLPDHA
jgi:hypothetical protein